MLKGRKITVGVTGGIAAYKAADIVSWLKQQGSVVRVAMTEGATHFITPLVMKTLSGNAVGCDIMTEDDAFHVPHIDLAECELFLIVPATANLLAKAAHGLADDLLSAALLATKAPVLCAPAMHSNMYQHPATQANLSLLRDRGWQMIEPGFGRLACGAVGQGRLADVETIKEAVCAFFAQSQLLAGKKVLVTGGPTYEYIDPVRFIGNRSSGRMGLAVAEAARDAGADVVFVLGPSALPDAAGMRTIHVVSAAEMYDAVWAEYTDADIVVMAAAVADYRPAERAAQKQKKGGDETLQLVRTVDILQSLGEHKEGRFLTGFAAETADIAAYAADKLRRKNLDLIIANDVAQPGAGFDVETNIVTAVWPEAAAEGGLAMEQWPLLSKQEVAARIIRMIAERMKMNDKK